MTDSALSGAAARRAARNASAIAIAQIISKGALYVWQILLAQLISTTAYGIYGTVTAHLQIGAVVTAFGLANIVIRDVARQRSLAGQYMSSALVIQTVGALIAYVGIFIASAAYPLDVRAFIALAGLSLFIDMLGNLCYDQLQAQERMVTTAAVEIGHIALRIALALLALTAGYGLLGVYIATLISGVARAGLLWATVLRNEVRPEFPLERGRLRGMLRDAAPLALGAFIGVFGYSADRLLAGRLLGLEQVAYLNASFVIIVGMVELLNTTVLIAGYPLLSRAYTPEGDLSLYHMMVNKLAFFTLVIVLPITLGVSIFAEQLALIFGADFLPAAAVLRWMVWYALLAMLAAVYAQALLVQNRQRLTLVIRVAGLGVNLVLLVFLLPRVGIVGAAVASIIGESLMLALLYAAFLQDRRARHSPSRVVRVIVAGIAGALTMMMLGQLHFILGAVGGVSVYIVTGLALRTLAPDDWALLRRLVEAMPGGTVLLRGLPMPPSS
ncbi:MAG: oligosaccharide flippase family protein [Chloroflexota bacterium]|nr:oligosaccharide flippase family protein [Chloroflexota bacterium]